MLERPPRLVPERELRLRTTKRQDALITFVSHIGTIMAWAPQSSALFIIQCSDAGILTIGDTPDVEMAPTWRYTAAKGVSYQRAKKGDTGDR